MADLKFVLISRTFSLLFTLIICEGLNYKPCIQINETIVDCKNRSLNYIPMLPNITEQIDFSWNTYPVLSTSFLKNLSHLELKSVNFRHCGINHISSDALTTLTKIEILDISENYIRWKALKLGLMGLNGSNITALNISSLMSYSNSTEEFVIPSDTFFPLTGTPLTNISMRNNRIRYAEGMVFAGLGNLTFLDLSINKIASFNMTGLPKIIELNLTMNELKFYPYFCNELTKESYVPSLEILHMGINFISDTYTLRYRGHCLPSLRHFNLSYNPIRSISGNSFAKIPELRTLSLKNLLVFEAKFSATAFNASKLEVLHIGNTLRTTPVVMKSDRIFKYCPNLEELDMTLFKLTYFKNKDLQVMFRPLRRLKTLILDSTSLNYVPKFDVLPTLEVLILRKNYIRDVHKDCFANNTNLRRLSISINHISVFSQNSFPKFLLDNIEELDLA